MTRKHLRSHTLGMTLFPKFHYRKISRKKREREREMVGNEEKNLRLQR